MIHVGAFGAVRCDDTSVARSEKEKAIECPM